MVIESQTPVLVLCLIYFVCTVECIVALARCVGRLVCMVSVFCDIPGQNKASHHTRVRIHFCDGIDAHAFATPCQHNTTLKGDGANLQNGSLPDGGGLPRLISIHVFMGSEGQEGLGSAAPMAVTTVYVGRSDYDRGEKKCT